MDVDAGCLSSGVRSHPPAAGCDNTTQSSPAAFALHTAWDYRNFFRRTPSCSYHQLALRSLLLVSSHLGGFILWVSSLG